MARTNLTAERLHAVTHYDPETGLFTWAASVGKVRAGAPAGRVSPFGYVYFRLDGFNWYCHRLAWLYMTGEHPPHDIDHINGARADNRWANLRSVTRSVNLQNQRKARRGKSTDCPLGVYRAPGNRFCAQITVSGVLKHLGSFGSPEEAHQCYLAAKREHHEGNML